MPPVIPLLVPSSRVHSLKITELYKVQGTERKEGNTLDVENSVSKAKEMVIHMSWISTMKALRQSCLPKVHSIGHREPLKNSQVCGVGADLINIHI